MGNEASFGLERIEVLQNWMTGVVSEGTSGLKFQFLNFPLCTVFVDAERGTLAELKELV